jgi:hypothetical protein
MVGRVGSGDGACARSSGEGRCVRALIGWVCAGQDKQTVLSHQQRMGSVRAQGPL